MKLDIYQIDAFADEVFRGNPAAVMPLDGWLDDDLMQTIAMENNLSETAFFVKHDAAGKGYYQLRWFTPTVEVDLCGHATLASAHVIWTQLGEEATTLVFATRSGDLVVKQGAGGLIEMDFPSARRDVKVDVPALTELLGVTPQEIIDGPTLMAVLSSPVEVTAFEFNAAALAAAVGPKRKAALIITAPGEGEADCVSRFFAPYAGIDEDPVTGSIHTTIVPYWAGRLGKKDIVAYQASRRGGFLNCTDAGDRTIIRGRCTSYMQGVVEV